MTPDAMELGKVRVPPTHLAPKAARDLVAGLGVVWGLSEDIIYTAQVAVSELVTNAVRIACRQGSTVLVTVCRVGDMLSVDVPDPSQEIPVAGSADTESESGRGLVIVGALTDHCGYRVTPFGKAAWFEIKCVWPLDLSAA